MGSLYLYKKAISDETRREILKILSKGSATAGDISRKFNVSKPAISNHLRILKEANLAVEQKVRQNRFYSINVEEIAKMKVFLERMVGSKMSEMPRVGDKAPEIEAETYGGEKIKLSDFKNSKTVVLYFYPKDNTPGCTKEACSMRDGMEELQRLGIQVLGVSTDSVKSHESFRDKYGLNFPLLSDTGKGIIRTYGVESEHGSARRVTFLVDQSGVIRHVWQKVDTARHAEEVKEKVKELGL